MWFIYLIAIAAILFGAVSIIMNMAKPTIYWQGHSVNEPGYTEYKHKWGEVKSKGMDGLIPNSLAYVLIGFGIFLWGVAYMNPFAINDAGNRQVIQRLNGKLFVKFDPGIYYAGIAAKVTTYPNNVTIQLSSEEHRSPKSDFWAPPNDGTFSEGDRAALQHTVKWDLPNDEPTMLELHTTYNDIANLATTTLLQFQKQTASYSCQRMSSEEHYSGGESQLNQYFQDQLHNGQVLLVTQTKTMTQTDGSTKTYIEVSPKIDTTNGRYLRNMESIQDIKSIGMRPSFASIDQVTYDPEIYEKLKKKIEYAAEEANSKQELVAEQQKAETAKVRGEKLIAEKKATEEAAKLEAVIRAQKEAEVALQNVIRDKAKAESTLALKRAEAEGDKLKVIAGLSPLEQAEKDNERAIGVAAELAKVKFPENMIIVGGGDSKGGDVNPFSAVGLQSFYELSQKMSGK